MAKEEMLEFEGVVAEVLPDARCRVKLDNGHEVIAYTSGRMKKNRIRILAGDRVTIEMTPYDLTKGRINFRHKDVRVGSRAAAASRWRRRQLPPPLSFRSLDQIAIAISPRLVRGALFRASCAQLHARCGVAQANVLV